MASKQPRYRNPDAVLDIWEKPKFGSGLDCRFSTYFQCLVQLFWCRFWSG